MPESVRHLQLAAPGGPVMGGAERTDQLVEVALPSGRLTAIDAGEYPHDATAAAGRIFVGDEGGDTVSVIDGRRLVDTLELLTTLDAGAGPSHVVADDDGRFYVADTGGDAILVFEPGPDPRLLDRANVPGSPYGIAIDERHGRLWVTQTALNEVTELELTDLAPRVVAGYPTVRQPNSVAVDSRTGRVFVLGRTGNRLQMIDPPDEEGAG